MGIRFGLVLLVPANRTFSGTVHNHASSTEFLFYSVLQGSVLGPMLFASLNCLNSIKYQMADNVLQLNTDETEVLISTPEGIVLKS